MITMSTNSVQIIQFHSIGLDQCQSMHAPVREKTVIVNTSEYRKSWVVPWMEIRVKF